MGARRLILSPKYKSVITTNKRYSLITGGRGSAKSFFGSVALEDLSFEHKQSILFSRYTLTSAHISIIPEFQEKIELLGHQEAFRVTNSEIENLHSGSKILFRGIKTSSGNQTANLKSIKGLGTFVVDEAEEFTSQEDFDKIDNSVRLKNVPNRVWLIMNPCQSDHWIYKRWLEGECRWINIDGYNIPISTHPEVEHVHTTWYDNIDNLSDSYIDKIIYLKESNPDKYARQFLGTWAEKAEGVIFENWEIGNFNFNLPSVLGLDYGYFPDPLAMVRVAVDERTKRIYLKEEIYSTKLKNEDLISFLQTKILKTELIVCDTNEPRTTEGIRNAGWNIQEAKKGPVVDDIREMQDYQIIVDPNSHNLIKELNKYAWNDKKASIPIGEHNHGIDASRYGFRRQKTPGVIAGY